jgi:hypothetical protein
MASVPPEKPKSIPVTLAGKLLAQPINYGKKPTQEIDPDVQAERILWLAPEAYYGIAGRYLRAVEPVSEAHPAGILGSFLTGFGSIVGRRAFFTVEDTPHFPILFTLITGVSSRSRKNTSVDRGLRAIKAGDILWSKECMRSSFSSGEALTGYFHAKKN